MLTLAAECQTRFGESMLRDVLRSGTDPHVFTAAMLLGKSYEEFKALEATDKATYDLHRKKAKIANFGFPAGYSAQSLAYSAKVDRGIEMSVAEAEAMRDRFLHEVYPEIGRYMTEDMTAAVASNLGVPTEVVRETFTEDWHLPLLRRLCDGETTSRSRGVEYDPQLIDEMFATVAELDTTGRFAEAIVNQDYQQLQKLFWQPTVNPVGMVRAAVPFTASRNTPFQSRAAMGMRNALWTLYRAGFDLMTCVHDEVVIAVPEDADHAALARQADAIMRDQMQPFCGDIPVKTECYLARHWSKQAQIQRSQDGRLLIWQGEAGE
jgi:DNA polymerase I-like protein with 3'-5' exonuclease and polymerase domains